MKSVEIYGYIVEGRKNIYINLLSQVTSSFFFLFLIFIFVFLCYDYKVRHVKYVFLWENGKLIL